MIKIYFDKQVFSYLKNNKDELYQNFYDSIKKSKSTLLYCYSHAYLLDLKNDRTQEKYNDLDFMEGIVGDNYLSYHFYEKKTSWYLAKPSEAFKDEEEMTPLSSYNLLDFDLSDVSEEKRVEFNKIKDNLMNQEIDFGTEDIEKLPKEASDIIKKFLGGKTKFSVKEWVNHFLGVTETMFEDKTFYKDIRQLIFEGINKGKFVIDENTIDFNEDLKNSPLQKTFIDYVNHSLNPNGDKQITDYDFHAHAYSCLDLLGLSRDKKPRFRNIFNDGLHSYYGSFCDYIVSNDDGFIKKTKILYKLLGIKTHVYELKDFILSIDGIAGVLEADLDDLYERLISDMKSNDSLSTETLPNEGGLLISKLSNYHYLGLFNRIQAIHKENQIFWIALTSESSNNLSFPLWREIEIVVNNAVKIFEIDIDSKGKFDFEKEVNEIKNHEWKGRRWVKGKVLYVLEINEVLDKFSLAIMH